jgi:hypothetical protein
MNPGDLVMPKGTFLRLPFAEPLGPVPGVLLERIRPPNPHQRTIVSWRILWQGGRYVIFDNEFEVIDDER